MKNTQKHTQGPWGRNIAPAWKYPVIFAGRNTHVAKIITDELPESEQEANAHLIAAAPDLLQALEDAAFLMRMAAKIAGPMQDSFKRSAEDAAKALAKAEGNA